MSNTTSIHLHELIKSLTASEKRYFRIYATRHHAGDKSGYLALFDLIAAQDVYNEGSIKIKSDSKSFANFTSITKNRLYNQILKSLDAFHTAKSAANDVNQQIHFAEILYHKALYFHCEKVLRAAGKTAEKNEFLPGILQITKWRKRLAEVHQFEKAKDLSIANISDLEQDVIKKINTGSQLWKLKSQLFAQLFKQGQLRDKKEVALKLPEFIGQMDQWNSDEMSFESSYLRNHSLSALYFGVNDYPNTFKYLEANLKLMEAKIHITLEDPSIYLATLTNLIYVTAKLNQFDKTALFLQKSKLLPGKLADVLTPDLKIRHEVNSYSLEMAITYLTGDSMRARSLTPEITKWLKTNQHQLSQVRKASIFTSLANLYFIIGDYKLALNWNNELLNTVSQDKATDQYRFAEMYHILLHFELGNTDLVRLATKRLAKYFDSNKGRFRFEKAFIVFFTKLIEEDLSSQEMVFREFLRVCQTTESDPYEKSILEYFDFTAWVKSKLNSISFAKSMQNRAPSKDVL